MEWNWQNSVKTLNVKFSQKTKFIFQPLNILTHFQIIYCICSSLPNSSQYLVTSVVISRYRTHRLAKFRHLFFSFRKVWGYSTLPISWFINFKKFYTVPPTPSNPPTINPSFSSNTPTCLTPLPWRYLFPETNHNHLNSYEINQINIAVTTVGILGTLHWHKY